MTQANEKYSWEMFWEQLLSELSISANLMYSTGKADVQRLLWKKNALNFSAGFFFFFSATALSPSGEHKVYFRTSLEHPLMYNDAEFAKKLMKNVLYLNYW